MLDLRYDTSYHIIICSVCKNTQANMGNLMNLLQSGRGQENCAFRMTQERQKPVFVFVGIRDHWAGGIRLLASILKKRGHKVKIIIFKRFDFTTNPHRTSNAPTKKEWDLLRQTVAGLKPAFVGVSYTSFEPISAKEIFTALREAAPQALLVSGGFGPTFEPERFLYAGAEYVIRGEGEYPLSEMAKTLSVAAGEDAESLAEKLKKIPNMAWLEDGQLMRNPLAPLHDMRSSPDYLYAEDMIYIEGDTAREIDPLLQEDFTYALTSSRGCLGRCSYCDGGNWLNNYKENGAHIKRYRTRNVANVIEECEKAKRLGAKHINFLDEFFVRPEKEHMEFFEAYGEKVGLPFKIDLHPEFILKDAKRFKVMFEAGLWTAVIGIQTGSVAFSEKVYNRRLNIGEKLAAVNLFHQHWVSSVAHFITGISMESEEDFRASLDLVARLPFSVEFPSRTSIIAFKFSLLPGAPIGRRFPMVWQKPVSPAETEYRRWLLRIRHILKDNDEFWKIYNTPAFRDKPVLLSNLFYEILNRLYYDFWARTSKALDNQKVIFYGAGETYQLYKHRLKNSVPQAMLIDWQVTEKKIDGIPVIAPDEILAGEKKPIIIFSQQADHIARNILKKYPHQDNIIACCKQTYPYL